ncbi:arginase family protein [Microbacterium sp. 1P10AE]|jgi:arginase|uniref:arginase family protein n=1 Tax=Microbacterium sp. 1P10AE TaxID=3132286 RepID=UPI0039A37D69
MTRFVIAPQWQGSSSSRAMQLIDGAEAIAGDLPRAATTTVEVPSEAGDAQGTRVLRASALVRMRERIRDAVAGVTGEHAVTIGGDCGVALGAVSAVAADDVAIVWIDAHADLNTPESSPSGAFHGMVLRAILGDGTDLLRLSPGIPSSRVVLAGTRALDAEEQRYVDEHGIRVITAAELSEPEALADAVAATGASRVYVHLDLDVLDPAEIAGVALPEPFGARATDVAASIRRLRERLPLAGATITEFSPASPAAAVDDLGTILRLIGALA